jgi:hypothetical protein
VAAAESYPAAPTMLDAHQYFASLIAGNGVTALYETRSLNGDILGFESFPVAAYHGAACTSAVTLKNGVRIDIDWRVVGKSQFSDGSLSILQGSEIQFQFFHMLSLEGGILVEPAKPIQRLIFGISDEVSRNRLVKAIDLMSAACRSKSKFD